MATEDVDYYALLGIEQTATSAEIRKAYRQKSLKVHPDRNPDDPQAAALFHELSIAADTLSDPTKRASFDALLTARNARKQRFAALDNKRRALAEDLELREREFKKQKAGEATEATRKKQELERLKEEGRRMREMRASQANAGVEAQRRAEEAERAAAVEAHRRSNPAATMNGPAGVVELGPLDKTLKVKWLKSVHPALDSPAAVSTFFRTALAPLDPDIDSAVLSSKTLAQPSKGKFGSGVVAFKSLSAANRAIKGKQADPDGLWEGFEVYWAAGSPPAALGGDAGQTPISAAGSNGAAQTPFSAPSPAPAAAVPKPPPPASDEDAILAKLRQRERERERLMEEMRRQDEEEASGGAAAEPAPTLLLPPNPYLTKPELYISGLPGDVEDGEIVQVLRDCLRLRLKLDRDPLNPTAPLTGIVEFESLDRAEKAYATCKRQRIGNHAGSLVLSFSPDPASDPRPLAQTLILKQLPKPFTPSELFDLVRPFGPVFSAVLLFAPPRDSLGPPTFKGQAFVTFYEERHATEARNALHFLEVQGQTIAVQVYDPNRAGLKHQARVSGPPPRQHSSSENESIAPPTRTYGSLPRAAESETPSPFEQAGPSLGLSLASGMSGPSTTSAARPQPRKVSKWAPTPPEESSGVSEQEGAGGSKPMAEVSQLESAMAKLATEPKRSTESPKDASSAAASEPAVQVKPERDRLAEGVAELVHDADARAEVLSLLLGLPKKERAKCLFNPDVLKLKVHDALAVLEADQGETREGPSVESRHAADDRSETEMTAPELATEPTKPVPDSLVDLATWSCADIVSILPALVQRFSLQVPPAAEVEELRAFMKALEGKPVGVAKQKLGERLFKVVKQVAKEQGLKGAPRITIELLDTEDLPALAELVLYPAILREKVISVGERLSIG